MTVVTLDLDLIVDIEAGVFPGKQLEDPNADIFQLSYQNEDPEISAEYYRELERKGITLRLPPLDQGGH